MNRGWAPGTQATLNKLDAVRRRLGSRYVGRERTVALLQLALVCREHLLLLGEPGTAKTDLVLRFADLLNADKFSYLLTRFTEPSEIFGSLDMAAFQDSTYRIRTDGMLPRAQIAFLDEIFQGSSAILNSLLTLINERMFHNGSEPVAARLLTLIGAANELPEDPVLRAFADRMLLRIELQPVAAANLDELLRLGWQQEVVRLREVPPGPDEQRTPSPRERAILDVGDVLTLSRLVGEVDLTGVTGQYQDVVRELLTAHVTLSDRRIVRGLKLVAGAALLRGADRADIGDFWPLMHFWTDSADGPVFEEIVQSRVQAGGGAPLHMVPTVEALTEDARHVFEQTRRRLTGGDTGPHVLEQALTSLQRIRRDLRRFHPAQTAADARVNDMIRSLLATADGDEL